MVLGFILPFLLAWAAIPLEMFVHAGRTVAGLTSAAALRFSAFSLRLVGNCFDSLSRLLVAFYDALVSPILLLERWVVALRANHVPRAESPKTKKAA